MLDFGKHGTCKRFINSTEPLSEEHMEIKVLSISEVLEYIKYISSENSKRDIYFDGNGKIILL